MNPQPELSRVLIPLSWIKENHDTQVRGQVSSARVASLEEIIQEVGGELDPIDLFYETGEAKDINAETPLFVADGFHRLAAYRGCGKQKIPAILRQGDKSEAIEFGLRRNCRHGTPMTAKEKRHAAELAVRDPRLGEFPDKKLAKIIGVSPTLISEARKGITAEAASEKRRQRTSATKPEKESPAPRPATARERKGTSTADRPTKKQILKQIEAHLSLDVIDESDLLELLASPIGEYGFLPKSGADYKLKVVGGNRRPQVEVPVKILKADFEQVTVMYTGGTLKLE